MVELCSEQLGWKKSTIYTVLRKLAEKGMVQNENTIVTSLVSKEQVETSAGNAVTLQLVLGEGEFLGIDMLRMDEDTFFCDGAGFVERDGRFSGMRPAWQIRTKMLARLL